MNLRRKERERQQQGYALILVPCVKILKD
jgi:hypothetical protein